MDFPDDEPAASSCPACDGAGLIAVRVEGSPLTQQRECTVCNVFRTRRLARIFSHANIPPLYRDANFGVYLKTEGDPDREPDVPAPRGLREAIDWTMHLAQRPSLFLWGERGVGKTWIAIAALRQRIDDENVDALFITTPDLLDAIRGAMHSQDGPTADDVFTTARAVGLLALDDLGAEKPTDWVAEKLYQLVDHRKNQLLPTIFTSNYNADGLTRHWGAEGGRIVDRIMEMSEGVRIVGADRRMVAP